MCNLKRRNWWRENLEVDMGKRARRLLREIDRWQNLYRLWRRYEPGLEKMHKLFVQDTEDGVDRMRNYSRVGALNAATRTHGHTRIRDFSNIFLKHGTQMR